VTAIDKMLEEIEQALEEGDPESALKLARKAVRKDGVNPDAWGLMAEALESLDDLAGAVKAYAKALDLDPRWASGHAHLAGLLIETGQLGQASARLDRALELDASEPEACHNFAILCELEGEVSSAARFYTIAAELDPDTFHMPSRVTLDDFDRMARRALAALPPEVHEFVGDVPIVVEDLPGRDCTGRFRNDAPLLLGECIGDHREAGGSLDPATCTPASIHLYKLNLERISDSRDELAEQVRITILHELLHWLGLDESEIADRGLL
jgi:predicted Zn-dependent protease with MMP-like domain